MNDIILVRNVNGKHVLQMYKKTKENKIIKIIETEAYIGKNGLTSSKVEGDNKTPKGKFKLGIAFGISDFNFNSEIEYIKINENLYWVDDIDSKWYNQLVDVTKVEKDWQSAEHLIDYKTQYEYGIEIKTNPQNIKGKGSVIFLHCTTNKPTAGCIAIQKEKMIEILKNINKNVNIYIL